MNNKLYIFLSTSICRLGGAERYVSGKAAWLQKEGWSVCIVGPIDDEMDIAYPGVKLINFDFFYCKPTVLPSWKIKSITRSICSEALKYECCFIESSSIQCGYWGEYLAGLLRTKHLIFHLNETLPNITPDEKAFLIRKAEKGELFFIEKGFAAKVVGKEHAEDCVLRAYAPQAIQDTSCDLKLIQIKGDFRIGCISRLDKPFLRDVVTEVSAFADLHRGLRIDLLIIGDTPSLDAKNRLIRSCSSSVSLILPGSMSPIPSSLVDTFDMGVGKSGGATCLAQYGIPTASYSLDTDECMGVLGFDLPKNTCIEEGNKQRFSEILEKCLKEKAYELRPYPLDVGAAEAPDYEAHFDAFQRGLNDSVTEYKPTTSSVKQRIKGVVYTILPNCFAKKISSLIDRVFWQV